MINFINGIHYSRGNEKNILGCFMISPESALWIPRVKREWFYDDTNRAIFDTILKLHAAGFTFSAQSICMALEGSLPLHIVTDCMNHVPGGVHGFKYGLSMLQGMYNYRKAIAKTIQPTTFIPETKKPNDFE